MHDSSQPRAAISQRIIKDCTPANQLLQGGFFVFDYGYNHGLNTMATNTVRHFGVQQNTAFVSAFTMPSIKTLLQEAETYRSQGLIDEAMEKYRTASEMLAKSDHIKNKKELAQRISEKMDALAQDVTVAQDGSTPTRMPKKSQDLIKNLSVYSTDLTREHAVFEGAVALAKFGQYERAMSEFNAFLSNEDLKVTAAKNIIRCHVALESFEKGIQQFQQWQDEQLFSTEDLETIRVLLGSHLDKKGIQNALSGSSHQLRLDVEQELPETVDATVNDAGISDILSISFYEDHSSQKGKVYEFDISFQSGNVLSFMVAARHKPLIQSIKPGDQVNNIQFFSTNAMFKGPGIVSAIDPITEGPKKGDFSVDLKIVDD